MSRSSRLPLPVFLRSAVSAAAMVVICAPALAQNTSAALSGRIVDAAGKPVAQATVNILHVESRSSVTTTTDADGRYSARGLRVGGPYSVSAVRSGQAQNVNNVFLALAETTALDMTLGAPAAQTITITGQATASERFNSANMGTGTHVNSRQLAALASIQRNLQDYARIDPRIAQTDKERGEISAAGQNSRFNSITIDGVTTNDRFGLESNNLPTAKQPISIDAIESVQVNVANYDVTQKGYTGANINATTRSGTNEFKGSVFHVFRNADLAGDRYNRTTGAFTPAPTSRETTNGFTLRGPIIKDQLFFAAAYEELTSSRTTPDFGPIGSSQPNVGITSSAISGLQSIARASYGLDLGTVEVPQGTNLTVKDSMLKLDWNINDNHRASLRYNKTDQSEPFFPNIGQRALSLSSHWYTQVKTTEAIVAQWFADWSPTFSTEFKLLRDDYASEPRNFSSSPFMAFDFSGAVPAGVPTGERTLNAGTERSRHLNQLFTKTWDAYLGATWARGKHELKFGADFNQMDVFNAFLQDVNGQYKFQCESAWTYSFGSINCGTATTAQTEAAVLENFRLGRPSAYQAQLPLPGQTLERGIAQWQLGNLGLFLQDTFSVTNTLNLNPILFR